MIYISIGSNLGNKLLNIKKALNSLKSCNFISLKQAILQPNADKAWDKSYLNMVVQGKSTLTPSKLLIELNKD
ncbi:2-amino-4-hydroxy-6-hydroxymethyldihydropteridine diphosphokinase [Rickettsia parkeri]|uniref:2-amino-4-hydroxy-6-hydroxymethyldihydropteridine diphosphokinase n=1 Tax=Rickettsia parkeri str. Tate's Hell TaxID=1359189 RepID=A0ABR5DNH0_RICPA|nr:MULTISPECIES: 2-amino-4-hydroxy-6-hydroxymethyldihydropteridine diphosphokinase [spotted fever group]AFC74239.1 folate synthesis bifunctional protein [Rickettsia parkeri str. Portsmouth]KJV93556.1 7,8-dihydro-6-hydroxymethylpterin-pyrophosphokinase family protein [Rickettsia parkeri str. Grand Bay]KJV95754.1 7,8-dihydro-6-hydroxymethylpterin-pyrophosphokinase family protein [Rickettsia parkeri str. AT\